MPKEDNDAKERAGSTRVVAIAGIPGAGKTTLAGHVAAAVGNAAILLFDGFEMLTEMPADALAAWRAEGADFSRFQVRGLAEALAALKAGRAVREPVSGRLVGPAPLVLFEMPLGRAFPPTRLLIDFLVWIDLPLDVALARNLAAFASADPAPPAEWFANYARDYLTAVRPTLMAQQSVVAPGADLVLDGTLLPGMLAETLISALVKAKLY
jgi:uridine kinase